jgi:hypothetical protein
MKYIYHYHLSYQMAKRIGVADIDGIATLENEILTMEDYQEFKKKAEPEHHEKTTIRSLTLLKVLDT